MAEAAMAVPLLVVGNKLYSSWSLRAWFLMRAFGLHFEHKVVSIYQPDSKPKILEYSPSGRVPVLIDGDVIVWDSLAITEYLSEKHRHQAFQEWRTEALLEPWVVPRAEADEQPIEAFRKVAVDR
jgi:glutathione S-transferase